MRFGSTTRGKRVVGTGCENTVFREAQGCAGSAERWARAARHVSSGLAGWRCEACPWVVIHLERLLRRAVGCGHVTQGQPNAGPGRSAAAQRADQHIGL